MNFLFLNIKFKFFERTFKLKANNFMQNFSAAKTVLFRNDENQLFAFIKSVIDIVFIMAM